MKTTVIFQMNSIPMGIFFSKSAVNLRLWCGNKAEIVGREGNGVRN